MDVLTPKRGAASHQMSKSKYLQRRIGLRTIVFPERVVSGVFEDLLNESYKNTFLGRVVEVTFDFSIVKWCEVFELGLIALWMLELLEAGKALTFVPPLDKAVYQFLTVYRFDSFLIEHNIQKVNDPAYKAAPATTELLRAPFFPLTFFNESTFQKLLEDLSFGNRLEIVLSDISETEIVKSGAIRDVVLKELGDNAIIHGDVRFAYLIMTKLGPTSEAKAIDWARNMVDRASPIERPFFERLGGNPFINLVIGDKGVGIRETLRNAYVSDPVISRRKGNRS